MSGCAVSPIFSPLLLEIHRIDEILVMGLDLGIAS